MGGFSSGGLDQRLLERLRTTLGVSRSVLASVSDTVLSVSYTHLRAHETLRLSRMPSSA